MLDALRGHDAANAVLRDGGAALGVEVRDWLVQPARLHDNAIAQPLICLAQLATWRALEGESPEPRAIAGYSVGELAGYGCAGALDAPELAHLAVQRAAAMDRAAVTPGGLVALRGLPRADV